MVRTVDKFWIKMGLRPQELGRERGRGALYVVVGICCLASAFLAADLALNVTGRFG